jgi:transcription initiation factor TFIIA large subunit
MMLCMYDKVQRVKNKWYVHPYPVPGPYFTNSLYRKCVLKDGVLTVNGKEYVFHKATGEYEW